MTVCYVSGRPNDENKRMATLIPSLHSVLAKMTPGEKRFARRLESHLEDDYLCWYEATIGPRSRRPDFIVLHPGRGLLVVEVKDWRLENIRKLGPGAFNFNQYLIVDDAPLLFHTGPRGMFPLVAEAIGTVVSAPFLEAMKAQGMRLREYPVAPGGSANCTLRDEDDAVVSRMRAELRGVRRLDVLARIEVGGREVHAERLEDVPFDAGAGEVLFLPSSAMLRRIPVHTARVRLVAVEEGAERPLGEYTFVHSPAS